MDASSPFRYASNGLTSFDMASAANAIEMQKIEKYNNRRSKKRSRRRRNAIKGKRAHTAMITAGRKTPKTARKNSKTDRRLKPRRKMRKNWGTSLVSAFWCPWSDQPGTPIPSTSSNSSIHYCHCSTVTAFLALAPARPHELRRSPLCFFVVFLGWRAPVRVISPASRK